MWRQATVTSPIAIDFGQANLRMLQLVEEEQRLAVAAAVMIPVPADLVDAAAREAWFVATVRDALSNEGFRGRQAVGVLGAKDFEIKNVRIPPMPPADIEAAVALEAQERFGLEPAQAEFRHLVAGQVRQGTELREEVIVFAAPRKGIERYAAMLGASGLEAVALDAAPCAMARAFVRFLRRSEDATAVNVFVDVGWQTTSLVITRGTSVCFVKLIDVGACDFNRLVSQRLSIPEKEVGELRVQIMRRATLRRNDPPKDDLPPALLNSIADAVRPAAEQLSREAHLSLRYFTVTFRGQRPECVTLVGGEAFEPALVSAIGAGIDIPCTIGYPLRGIGRFDRAIPAEQRSYQPAWAVAVGLAIRGSHWVGPALEPPAPSVSTACEPPAAKRQEAPA